MAQEAIDFALKQQSGEGAQSKAKRRGTIKAKRRLDGVDRGAEEPEGRRPEKTTSRPKKAKGTNQMQVAGPQEGTSRPVPSVQGTENPWQLVSTAKRKSNVSRPAKKAKDRGEAL